MDTPGASWYWKKKWIWTKSSNVIGLFFPLFNRSLKFAKLRLGYVKQIQEKVFVFDTGRWDIAILKFSYDAYAVDTKDVFCICYKPIFFSPQALKMLQTIYLLSIERSFSSYFTLQNLIIGLILFFWYFCRWVFGSYVLFEDSYFFKLTCEKCCWDLKIYRFMKTRAKAIAFDGKDWRIFQLKLEEFPANRFYA